MQILARLNRLALTMAATGLMAGSAAALSVWLGTASPARRPLAPLPAIAPAHEAGGYPPLAPDGEALRRPLFTSTRRPPPKPTGQVMAGGNDGAPDLVVNGTIAGGDVGAVAGIDKRTQRPFSLRAGENMGDWQVDSISKDGLRLRYGDQIRDYPLQLPPPPPKAQRQP